MSAPKMTIVIPTLNRAKLVGRAVASAVAQTCPDLEILVSDNGSRDNTMEVLETYASDPRVRILHRGTTIPMHDHANFLLEQARGELYVGLSDDDWLEPDMAAKTIARFEADPSLSLVWTGCLMHYGDLAMPALVGPEVETGEDFLRAFLAGKRNPCWCACVARRKDLLDLGRQPEGTLCGDMFYWTKLAMRGRVGCVRDALCHYVCYRPGGDGVSGGTPIRAWTADQTLWVRDMLAFCGGRIPWSCSPIEIDREAARFMARTIATQFAWNLLRGMPRLRLWRDLGPSVPFLMQGSPRNWISVAGALLAPRWLLRSRVLAEVARRAKARSSPETQQTEVSCRLNASFHSRA